MTYSEKFSVLSNDEMMSVDGGVAGAAIWAGVKAVAAIVGVGAAGVVVGAGVVIGTYYACKAIFG